MKRIVCIGLILTLLLSVFSTAAFAVGLPETQQEGTNVTDAMTDIRAAFDAQYRVTSTEISASDITLFSDIYEKLPMTVTIYNDPTAMPTWTDRADATRFDETTEPNPNNPYRANMAPDGRPFILYVVNTAVERIGTDSDVSIITDLLAEGYLVAVIDFHNNKNAVSPNLDWNLQFVRMAMAESNAYLGGVKIWADYNYILPAGYTIRRGVQFYNYAENAPAGVLDKIAEYWNSPGFRSYFGERVIVWPEGRSVSADAVWENEANRQIKIKYTIANTVEDCVKADGSPIDLNLYMDIVYPTGGAEVPVACLASSSETRSNANVIAGRPHMTGFLFHGYAGVTYDHPYTPMSREDHYGYYQGDGALRNVFTLGSFTYVSCQTAMVRCLRYLSDTYEEYNFKEDGYGAWGHSKGAWTNVLGTEHPEELAEFAAFSGDDAVIQSTPWTTYGNGDPIPSGIQFVYSSNGGGHHYLFEDMAPTVVTQGEADGLFDGWLTHYSAFMNALKQYDIPTLGMTMPGVGHTTIYGYSEKYQFDMYAALYSFADYYLKGAPAEALYITPVNGTTDVGTADKITVKFTAPIPESEIGKVKVVNSSTGVPAAGTWSSVYGDTEWTFTPQGLLGDKIYTVVVPADLCSENGNPVKEAKSVSFRTVHEASVTGSVTSASPVLTKTADSAQGVYFLFENADTGSSVGGKLRFTVSADAVNTVSVYAVTADEARSKAQSPVLTDPIAQVKVNGAGRYDADISAYLDSVSGEGDLAFYLTADRVTGITTTALLDFDHVTGSPTQDLGGSKVVVSPTDPSDKVRYLNATSTLLRSIIMNGISEKDLGRRIRFSFDALSLIDRTMFVGIMDDKEAGTAWRDWSNDNMTLGKLKAGEWQNISFEYNILNPDFVTYGKYGVAISVEGSSTADPDGLKYVDDMKIEEIVTDVPILTSADDTGVAPTLVLYPSASVVAVPVSAGTVESGDLGDTPVTEGTTYSICARTGLPNESKVYARFALSDLPRNHTAVVNLKVTTESTGTLRFYGIDNLQLSSSWAPDTITYDNAPAAVPYVLGADLTRVMGGAPIAEVKINGAGDYPVNLTDYFYTMIGKVPKEDHTPYYATVIIAGDSKNDGEIAFTFDTEVGKVVVSDSVITEINFDNYTTFGFATRRDDNVAGVTDVYMQGDNTNATAGLDDTVFFGETGKSVKIGGTTTKSYNTYKFWKLLPVFSEEEIGDTYTLTFKMMTDKALNFAFLLSTCGNSTTYSATNPSSAQFQRRDVSASELPVNEWKEFSYDFTVTADMTGAPASKPSLDLRPILFTICTNYAYGSNIWVDDFTLVKHAKSQSTLPEFHRYVRDFEDKAEPGYNGLNTSQRGLSVTENATYGGTTSAWASLQVTYGRILIGNVINDTNTLSAKDIGSKVRISFKYKVSKAGSFYISLANGETATDTSYNSWLARAVVSADMVGQWNTYVYETVICEEMLTPMTSKGVVTTSPATMFCLFLNGFGSSGADFYLDDVVAYVNYSDAGELCSPDDAVTVAASGVSERLSVLGEDPATGVNKTYVAFDGEDLDNIQRVLLKFNVQNADGEKISLWALKGKDPLPASLTYNNAPASTVGEGMNPDLVFGGEPVATLTAQNGYMTADVTAYVASHGYGNAVFVLSTADGDGKKLSLSDFSLITKRVYNVTVIDETGEKTELSAGSYVLPLGVWLGDDGTVRAGGSDAEITKDTVFTAARAEMLDGAAIRTSAPTGMKFTARLDRAIADVLIQNGTEYEFGVLIVPTDKLTVDFTKEALDGASISYLDVKADPDDMLSSGAEYLFDAAIAQILPANYGRAFSAVAYLTVGGVTVYSAYDPAKNSRSVYEVAKAAYADRVVPTAGTPAAELLATPGGASTIVSILIDDTSNIATVEWLNEQSKIYGVKGSSMLIAGQLTPELIARYQAVFADGNVSPENHTYTHKVIPATYWTQRQNPVWTAEQIAAADTEANYIHEFTDAKTQLESIFEGHDILTVAASNNTLSLNAAKYLRTHVYAVRCGVQGIQNVSKTSPNLWIPGENDATEETSNGTAAFGSWQNLSIVSLRLEQQYETGGKTVGVINSEKLDTYVSTAKSTGVNNWFIGFNHDINEGYQQTEGAKFFAHIKELTDAGDVANLTFTDAVKYLREYQNTEIAVTSNANGEILITPTMAAQTAEGLPLTASVFNYPISAKVEVPASWRGASYRQTDGACGTAASFVEDGKTYAIVELVPGAGTLTVTDGALEEYVTPVGDSFSPYTEEQLAVIRSFLDGVVELTVSGGEVTVIESLWYDSPYAVSYGGGTLTVEAKSGSPAINSDTVKTVILNGRIYTSGWTVSGGVLTAPYTE